jgi:hypothetical protein
MVNKFLGKALPEKPAQTNRAKGRFSPEKRHRILECSGDRIVNQQSLGLVPESRLLLTLEDSLDCTQALPGGLMMSGLPTPQRVWIDAQPLGHFPL